jgi:hypothetical protein
LAKEEGLMVEGLSTCQRCWSWTASISLLQPGRPEPPHVHVRKGDAVAKLWLQPVRLDFSEGFNPSEIRRIRELTFEHQGEFVERWNEYFRR